MKRDNMLLSIFILIIYITFSDSKISTKNVLVNLLEILAISIHEAFAIFSIPIIFLLLLNVNKLKFDFAGLVKVTAILLPSISLFALFSSLHGSMSTAQFIWNSWVDLLGLPNSIVTNRSHGFISSIGWGSLETFKFHFSKNFFTLDVGVYSFFFWTLAIISVYYITSNYLTVFNNGSYLFSEREKLLFSGVLVFQLITLVPFFIVLSCDLGRIFFYWISTSFTILLISPSNVIEKIFPNKFYNLIDKLNFFLNTYIPPTKQLLTLLMILIGIPTIYFSFEDVVNHSLLGNVLGLFSHFVRFFIESF